MIVRIAEDVIWRDLGEEVVILNLATSTYFGLSGAGSHMWRQFAEHGSPEQTVAALEDQFEVATAQLRADLDALLRDLESRDLIVLDKTRSAKGVGKSAKPGKSAKAAKPAPKKSAASSKPRPAAKKKERRRR